ncbi:MAG: tetratricopeptide repeat protein [Isosphaerales bacterium]
MTSRSLDRQAARPGMRRGARARSIVIGSCLAVIGVTGGGCVVTPRQAGAGAGSSPPQVPESATGAAAVAQDRPGGPKTDFHETATDRQRFQVHIDFGRVFESQGNFDAAVLEYQDALTVLETTRRGPFQPADEALAHRRMGGALDRLGRFAQAEVHYKKALKLSPKDPKIWNDAGYSYYLQGRWTDAELALRTAGKLAPDDERIHTNLGLTLAAAGKPDDAFPLLSQSNGDAVGHANLGYLLAATGQFDLARRQYETALALRPNLELARRALARLDRQQDGVQQASQAPEPKAQVARSMAAPVDAGVNQASASRPKIPPPRPSRIPPAARSPHPVDPEASRAVPPSTLDSSNPSPPAPR